MADPGATTLSPTGGDPDPTQYTGYLLRRAYARSIDCERACLGDEAGLRDIALLATLQQDGPTSQRGLGEVLHVNRSVMVKLVDGLENRGWVARERNPDDRRSYALRLTEAGGAALQGARSDLARLERDVTAGLDDVERAALVRHLRTLLGDAPMMEVAGLGEITSFLLTHAHRTLRQRAAESFAGLGIDPRGFGILSIIEADQPCAQVHVAAQIGVTPPAVQGAIDELEGRGLLRRTPRAGDRRVHDLALTDDGSACLAAAREAAREIQSDVTRALGVSAEVELRDLLQRLIA